MRSWQSGLACSSTTPNISSGNLTQWNNISLFVYTPCRVDFGNNNAGGVNGQIIGGQVNITNQMVMNYVPVIAPAFNLLGYNSGIAYKREIALPRADPRRGDAHRLDACSFLAHEAARRPGHSVHNGNIAGEQIGKLCQEKSRPQIVHQLFIEKCTGICCLRFIAQNRAIDCDVAFSARCGNDQQCRQ